MTFCVSLKIFFKANKFLFFVPKPLIQEIVRLSTIINTCHKRQIDSETNESTKKQKN